MDRLAFRQVHLDFHTTEMIKGIGSKFSRAQFQKALRLGHVNSITIFSKCHHGWAYHPSKANQMHPHLQFDLLGEMIAAAHEIGVKTPVYLSAGLDEKIARVYPQWLVRRPDESTIWVKDFTQAGYHKFCMNTPYLDVLVKQIEEVVTHYDADGIFLDIVGPQICYCQNCVATLRAAGKDPEDTQAVRALAETTYTKYARATNVAARKKNPNMPVFHNGGHITRGRRELTQLNSHLELESLPTGGWGYDHFPLSARYVQNLGQEFLGMTGKFHTSWGEFGGYKHPNALRYEAALSIANGAKVSIGDQLHPNGFMDEASYQLIGTAYTEVERKEEWCNNVYSVADVALLSIEALGASEQFPKSDIGAIRILLEGKILFDVVDLEADFTKYTVLILPDGIRIGDKLKIKLEKYLQAGGKILASGESGLNNEGDSFALDFGAQWISKNEFKPDFFHPKFAIPNLGKASFIFYAQGQKIKLTDGKALGTRENPYFNRSVQHFCSHQHSPNSFTSGGPGMVENKNGIYFAWNVFEDYATKGSLAVKETVLHALNLLLPHKTLSTNLPAQGIVTLMQQKNKKRFVQHLLYASPVKRGENIEVIEDIVPIYNTKVTLNLGIKIKKVYLAPQMEELKFKDEDGRISYTVPVFECHQMVVLEY